MGRRRADSDTTVEAATGVRGQAPAPRLPAGPLREILVRRGARLPGGGLLAVTGYLQGIDHDGRVLFRADGAEGAPVPVGIGMEVSDGVLVKAARSHKRAMVISTAGAEPQWVLVGIVRERVDIKARDAAPGQLAVEVDGETVRLTADHTIELKCGKSSLTLRKDGKVVLAGEYLISTSRGANKIRGATISLN